jgi:C_GCAxxG_C_C family probable redox protein
LSAETLGKRAAQLHLKGYNCAQTVLLVLYEYMYPEAKSELIPKVATGLGGGIGRCGNICGALTGAVLAVGLKYGANEIDPDAKALSYAKTQMLFHKFEVRYGSVNCLSLIKHDLSTAEGFAKAKEEKTFENICSQLIKSVVANFLKLDNP